MIVTATSAANQCLYCVVAHGAIGRSAAGLALLQSGVDIPAELEPLVA